MKRMGILVSALILLLGLSLPVQASLVDMNDGTIYDTATQLTWLKNANSAGMMTWTEAVAWAESLNAGSGFAGLKGWRLPTTTQPDKTCSDQATPGGSFPLQGHGHNCTGSEMGYLYYVSLGNTAGGLVVKPGPFTNIRKNFYWSGTEYAPSTTHAWSFVVRNGFQFYNLKTFNYYVWPVRPGERAQPNPAPTRQ
ncbi:MAG TPA: DUF1566 domain-containing protein [Thermodesulfovibrionales bacterium]|nr:DUF1566 domain-containing protein [Thermodesulfovibrionales bacterium]